jgi:AraC-like DNA-binding protein/quercetin dioxygenase-like cupin family protein
MMVTAEVEEQSHKGRYEDGFRVMQGQREFVTYLDESSFRMWYSDIPWRYEAHMHTATEVVLTLEGCVEYTVEDQLYRVEKGEILVIPPDRPHALSMEEGSSRLLFLFEPEPVMGMRDIRGLTGSFNRVFYLRDGSETHLRIREMLQKAADVYRSGDLMWNTVCYSYMMRIYAALGQHYLEGRAFSRPGSGRNVDSEVITASMNYINSHYQENLTLDAVADFSGFSRFYFSRSFKKQTGYSFKDYLCQKRLQVAADLLTRTDMPMKKVATQSGFGSVATFNRVFREYKGCTPTKYRAIYGTF